MFVVNLCDDLESRCSSSNSKRGRPKKNFEECCDRVKRYKINELRNTYSQKLIDAAASSFTDSTDDDTAFDTDSALALIIQAKLSKYQYEILRKATQDIGRNIFPCY